MTLAGDAFEAGLQIADALESHGVALGGALAYGQYGIPRATNDVDVNVFVEVDSLGPVFVALQSLGIVVDASVMRAGGVHDGCARDRPRAARGLATGRSRAGRHALMRARRAAIATRRARFTAIRDTAGGWR
jgi:hypothetical protein